MNIVKHSIRTNRKPCRSCGSTSLYWGHDMNRPGNRPCEEIKCPGHGHRVSWVLLNADGITPHANTCPSKGNGPTVVTPEPSTTDDVDDAAPVADPEPVAPVIVPDPVAGSDAGAALWGLVEPYAKVGVNAEDIDRMVAEAWKARSVPVTVTVDHADGRTVSFPAGTAHHRLPDVLVNLTAGEHTMMVGPAATGKSTIAEQCAEALGVPYYSLSLSPQTPASALLGYLNAEGHYVESLFYKWHTEGGVFHFDEMDNGHPSILATVNAALSGAGHIGFPCGMRKRHPDAICVGSANTYGRGADRKYVGRSPLDVATLDRFTVEDIDYDNALEDALCAGTGFDLWSNVTAVVRKLRQSADRHAMPVVFSPRASVGICKLLKAGRTWEDCVNVRLRRGLSDQDWSKVTDGITVSL